jgi:plastocyanin
MAYLQPPDNRHDQNANPGDTVTFVFQQKNHTATQSTFANPCSPAPGGFDSGLYVSFPFFSSSSLIPFFSIPVSDNNTNGPFQQAQFQVTDTNPVWVYCRQTGHCQKGMVFAINPGNKFAAFQAAAMGNTTTTNSSSSATPTSTASSTSSTSQDHKVIVGGTTLTFEPANITAQPGDTITFEFHQKNHTITQSSFANPCQMLSSNSTSGQVGFDSGLYVLSLSSFIHTCRSCHTILLACLSARTPPHSRRTPSR